MESMAATVLALAVCVILVIANHLRSSRKNRRRHPPQPPSWPIIGHFHLLNRTRPLHRILSSLSRRYGPIMHLQLGCRSLLVISSSRLAKECFTTNDKIFASRPQISLGEHMGYGNKIIGFAPYGDYWRSIRKLSTFQLLSANRIESFKHVRAEQISSLIRSLFESCGRQRSGTVNMRSRLGEFTFNLIVRMVASKNILEHAHSQDSHGAQHLEKIMIERAYLAGGVNLGDYLPFLKWLDLLGRVSAMKKLQMKCDAFLQTLVDDHRHRRRISAQQTEEDLIDVLLSSKEDNEFLSDDAIKATALSMISAGTETTAVTLEWALAALLQNPHILRKAQQELDTHIGRDRVIEESDLHKLTYLQAIVKETFRLYPAGPLLLPHESTEDCTVGGFHVPAGTRLIVNVWAIQRDPGEWERPTEFDPERFLKSEREIDVKGHNFELLPFGSGRRMCSGSNLALLVVSCTLARMLQSFEWSVPGGSGREIDMEEGLALTLPKAVPLEAIIQPRLPPHLY